MKKIWLNPEVTSLEVTYTLGGGTDVSSPDDTWVEFSEDGKLRYEMTSYDPYPS